MKTTINGKPWIGSASMKRVDKLIVALLPVVFKVAPEGKKMSAVDAVLSLKAQASTQVLATVFLPSWRESRALGSSR